MFRVKYQLCINGTQPQKTIVDTIPYLTHSNLRMGEFPQFDTEGDWLYGEIDCLPEDEQSLLDACTDWELTKLTDQEALDFADNSGDPPGTIIQPQLTIQAATIENNRVIRKYE